MGQSILWAIVGGFLSGVFVESCVALSWPVAVWLLTLSAAAFLYACVDKEARRFVIVGGVFVCAVGVGVLRMNAAVQVGESVLTSRLGEHVVIKGVVVDEPDTRDSSVHVSMRAYSLIIASSTIPIDAGVLVFAPLHSPVAYGDVIEAAGVLRLPEPFDTGQGRVFRYPEYLAKDGVLYQLSFARVDSSGERAANPAKSFALWVKQELLRGLQNALPEPEAGLAAGITLGDKRAGGSELAAVFTRASLIHIVVLSGYNITVVINAASRALSVFPRLFRFGASGVIVAFFILMTGGAATAVRAGIMAFLAVYARMSGRNFIALRALGVAALAMVLWNPFTLVFDPSFQLSALATLGLIALTPILEKRTQWIPARFGLREIVASTVATQCFVLPLLLYQSGNLSLVALPANIFALAAVPFAMAFSSVAALGGIIAPALAVYLGVPAYVLLAYIIEVAHIFASLPYASVSVPAFSAYWVGVAYAGLGALLLHGRYSQKDRS